MVSIWWSVITTSKAVGSALSISKRQGSVRDALHLVAHAGKRQAGHLPELPHVVDVEDPLDVLGGDNLHGRIGEDRFQLERIMSVRIDAKKPSLFHPFLLKND
jgi:hypothetical protein